MGFNKAQNEAIMHGKGHVSGVGGAGIRKNADDRKQN